MRFGVVFDPRLGRATLRGISAEPDLADGWNTQGTALRFKPLAEPLVTEMPTLIGRDMQRRSIELAVLTTKGPVQTHRARDARHQRRQQRLLDSHGWRVGRRARQQRQHARRRRCGRPRQRCAPARWQAQPRRAARRHRRPHAARAPRRATTARLASAPSATFSAFSNALF